MVPARRANSLPALRGYLAGEMMNWETWVAIAATDAGIFVIGMLLGYLIRRGK